MSRFATVCVESAEPPTPSHNDDHIELMARVCWSVNRRAGWANLDAVLFPAGFFQVEGRYVNLSLEERLVALAQTEAGAVGRASARKLRCSSPGSVVVVGVDTPGRRRWRGDMMVAAISPSGPVAVTRMIYPVKGDRMMVSLSDADTPGRLLMLQSGKRAILCVCYDAFALAEIANGQLGARANLGWVASAKGKPRPLSSELGIDLMKRLQAQLWAAKPDLALIAIHRFRRPGAELLWQRHGIATASAALGGGLALGASHYLTRLPSPWARSPLASQQVGLEHLRLGMHRKAEQRRPVSGFSVSLPWAPSVRALVRLYTTD